MGQGKVGTMRVHIVGSSGTFPAPGRPAAGFIVHHGSTRVWSDAGPGTFMSLPIDTDLIDAVVVSHHHPDHCADLLAAFHAWTWRPEPRIGVPLYAPQSVWDKLCGFIDSVPECFTFQPVAGGDSIDIGPMSVSFVDMDHPVPTVGSKWEADGRNMFYTADTGPKGDWREIARGADVLLSEASILGDPENKEFDQHLTASEAGAIAREIRVDKLVLTHIPPYLDETEAVAQAETTFGKPVSLAVPGTSFDV